MTLKQLQEQIAAALNADELLRQGGCKTIAGGLVFLNDLTTFLKSHVTIQQQSQKGDCYLSSVFAFMRSSAISARRMNSAR